MDEEELGKFAREARIRLRDEQLAKHGQQHMPPHLRSTLEQDAVQDEVTRERLRKAREEGGSFAVRVPEKEKAATPVDNVQQPKENGNA